MNKYTRILILLALIALLCPEFAISQPDSGGISADSLFKLLGLHFRQSPGLPLDIFLKPVSEPTGPGVVDLRLTLVSYQACNELELRVRRVQNLDYAGPDVLAFDIEPGDTVTHDFTVLVPSNDTSGIEFNLFCGRMLQGSASIWFETWSDSISWSQSPPWGAYGHPDTWRRRTSQVHDLPRRDSATYKGPTTRRGYEDSLGNFIPTDSLEPDMVIGYYDKNGIFVRVPNPADSLPRRPGYRSGLPFDSTMSWTEDDTGYWHYVKKDSIRAMWKRNSEPEKPVDRMELMHELEKSPLVGISSQRFVVGDKLFERKEGEYEFKEVVDKPPENYSQWRDSVAMASTKTFDFTLDLRNPDHYEIAVKEIDSLISTDSAGFYRAIVTFRVVSHLRDQGIVIRRTATKSRRERDTRGAIERPTGGLIELSANWELSPDGVETILSESFNLAFPGTRWTVWDELADFLDSTYWGIDTCRYMSDTHSVWCAGGGLGGGWCPDYWYDWEMEAHMELATPLNVSRHTNIELRHHVWYQTWEDTSGWYSDICIVRYSQDGSNWTDLDYYDGNQGWQLKSYFLETDTLYPLFLQYVFYSGFEAEVLVEDGVFFDNVLVRGEKIPWPDLTYATPSGWSGPIVPSHQQNTNVVDVLYAGQTTYFDFGVKNIGDVASPMFWLRIWVDGLPIQDIQFSGINSNDFGTEVDWEHTISTAGQHTIGIEIDVGGDIDEENENNNYYEQTFTWEEPPVYEPNLTYTLPWNWDAPIVASKYPGGHRNTALFINAVTYIDWNVKNTGNAQSSTFVTYLLVDGDSTHGEVILGLNVGEQYDIDDIECTVVDSGDHTLRIVIDTLRQVAESNELDNDFDTVYNWRTNYVTMDGAVYYLQPRGDSLIDYVHELVGYRAELWDADSGQDGEMLASTTTTTPDIWGINFSFAPVSNVEEDGTGQDLFVRFIAYNQLTRAGTQVQPFPPYNVIPESFDTDTIVDCVDGTHTWGEIWGYYSLPEVAIVPNQSGFFYIADMLRNCHHYWDSTAPPLQLLPLSQSQAIISDNPTQYLYVPDSIDIIFIDSTSSWPNPDVFDQHQIIHEFAHRLQYQYLFLNEESNPNHTWQLNPEDLLTALKEGFAYWWAGVMTGDDTLYRTSNDFRDTVFFNLEDGTWGRRGIVNVIAGTVNAHGLDCEGSVAGILWDIVDYPPDDFSSRSNWDDTVLNHSGDGIWDSLYLGPGPETVLLALLDSTRLVAGHLPKTMDEFWTAWFSSPSLGYCQELFNVYYEHGDSIVQSPKAPCDECCIVRGNVDGDPGGTIDISDLVYLVDYIFTGGPLPPCFAQADMDGSGGIDISDLVWLVDYMFTGGPPPLVC